MRGLFTKSLHEVWLTTLLFGLSLLAVEALLTYILPQLQQGLSGCRPDALCEILSRCPTGNGVGRRTCAHDAGLPLGTPCRVSIGVGT